jgi:hypothetical protein
VETAKNNCSFISVALSARQSAAGKAAPSMFPTHRQKMIVDDIVLLCELMVCKPFFSSAQEMQSTMGGGRVWGGK